MNPGMLGIQTCSKSMAYSESWNIHKSDEIYIPPKHIYCLSEIVPGYNYFSKRSQTILDVWQYFEYPQAWPTK